MNIEKHIAQYTEENTSKQIADTLKKHFKFYTHEDSDYFESFMSRYNEAEHHIHMRDNELRVERLVHNQILRVKDFQIKVLKLEIEFNKLKNR
jgi:hypothetical protein